MNETELKSSHDILKTIGATLAGERERQSLTLANISQRLRILEEHLTFIETGQMDKLPAMTYVIGYIRSYARLLQLDDVALCAELKASLTKEEDRPEYKFIENNVDKKTGAGRVALAALIAGIMIYGGWYSLSINSSSDTSVDVAAVSTTTVEDVAATGDLNTNNNDEAEAEATTPEFVAVAPRAGTTETSGEAITPAITEADTTNTVNANAPTNTTDNANEADSSLTAQQPSESAAQTEVAATQSSSASPLVSPPQVSSTAVTDAYAVNRSPDTEIIIEAIANSWVEVRRADGTSVTSRLMRLGDTYLVPTDEDLFLTTGNAGGLNIRMGSDDPFTLGAWGEALRELPLNKAIITDRY